MLLPIRFFSSSKTACNQAFSRSGSRCKMTLKDRGLGRYLSMGSLRAGLLSNAKKASCDESWSGDGSLLLVNSSELVDFILYHQWTNWPFVDLVGSRCGSIIMWGHIGNLF